MGVRRIAKDSVDGVGMIKEKKYDLVLIDENIPKLN